MKKQPKPEWSHAVAVDDIGHTPAHYKIVAGDDARAELADRFGIIGIDELSADVTVTRERGGSMFRVAGIVRGVAVQECVATLEPVSTTIEESFDAFFNDAPDVVSFAKAKADHTARVKQDAEIEMLDEDEAPELVRDGVIDIAEVAAQFFALGLPAYPRKDVPVVEVRVGDDGLAPDTGDDDPSLNPDSPFAALKAWRDDMKRK
jgi:uncharacterized metal-binding protein YceD (DUF177 family)